MKLALYRAFSYGFTPFAGYMLRKRLKRGKEDGARLHERLGHAFVERPAGVLMWLHAASVGESLSLLPLITLLHNEFADLHLLVTTGTVTSAELMERRLPKGVIHQYVPIDVPAAVERFMDHWQPEIALWAESELWPNLTFSAYAHGCHMVLAGARMSQRSFTRWKKAPSMIRKMLDCFETIFVQSEADAERFTLLGGKNVWVAGNMKFDADPLEYDPESFNQLQEQIGTRPVWLAASTHPGEEVLIAAAHQAIAAKIPNILTLIVPRHAVRGTELAQELSAYAPVALRSAAQPITNQTGIYIADSMGEMGLFYRLGKIAFIGGSLVPHGGQNMLEAIRLGAAIISGPYTHNFAEIIHGLETARAIAVVEDSDALAEKIVYLLENTHNRTALAKAAFEWLSLQQGATGTIFASLQPTIAEALSREKRS